MKHLDSIAAVFRTPFALHHVDLFIFKTRISEVTRVKHGQSLLCLSQHLKKTSRLDVSQSISVVCLCAFDRRCIVSVGIDWCSLSFVRQRDREILNFRVTTVLMLVPVLRAASTHFMFVWILDEKK